MKVGGTYLMKHSNVYYIIKIIKILKIIPNDFEPIWYLVNYEYIDYSAKIYFSNGTADLNVLKSYYIIKSLNRKIWYKAVREYCNGDSR